MKKFFATLALVLAFTGAVTAGSPLTPPDVSAMEPLGFVVGRCGSEVVGKFIYDADPEDPNAWVAEFRRAGDQFPYALYDPRQQGFVWFDTDRDGIYDGGYPVETPEGYWTPVGGNACSLLDNILSGRTVPIRVVPFAGDGDIEVIGG